MYALIENDSFVRFINIISEYPEIVFSNPPLLSELPLNVVKVEQASIPDYSVFEKCVRSPTPIKIDGSWFVVWSVRSTTPEEFPEVQELFQNTIIERVQKIMDDFARTRIYDSMGSACSYSKSSVERFRIEGQYCLDMRDFIWGTLFFINLEISQGTRSPPASYDEILSLLPVLEWPTT